MGNLNANSVAQNPEFSNVLDNVGCMQSSSCSTISLSFLVTVLRHGVSKRDEENLC